VSRRIAPDRRTGSSGKTALFPKFTKAAAIYNKKMAAQYTVSERFRTVEGGEWGFLHPFQTSAAPQAASIR